MKNRVLIDFDKYKAVLDAERRVSLDAFFRIFEERCLLPKKEAAKLRADLENALLYYAGSGLSFEEALRRLDPEKLGSFYHRPALLWFPLDDAAKIYPLSMTHGAMAVFRLSVCLREPVIPELLQVALDFCIKRFPSFATTLKKGVFWHYLDSTKRRFNVEKEDDLPCRSIRVSGSGSQSFRVLYYENRISVEFFHVLTDGSGGMVFLKALAAEYLRLKGSLAAPCEGVYDIDSQPLAEEFENAFGLVPFPSSGAGFGNRAALQMSGRLASCLPCRVIHFKMKSSALKAVAAGYGVSVTAYLLALIFISIKASVDELTGELAVQLPVNLRQHYPSSTVRNFSLYCSIRIAIENINDKASLIAEVASQIKAKASKQAMSEMLGAAERLVGALKYVPLALKQPAARWCYGFLGDRVFSTTFSNLGETDIPAAMADQVESMSALLGTASINRAECTALSAAGVCVFSVTKNSADPAFEQSLYKLLLEDGIELELEGSGLYGN